MNRILAAALLLLGLGTLCLAVDDRREPALKYTLEINGQKHEESGRALCVGERTPQDRTAL